MLSLNSCIPYYMPMFNIFFIEEINRQLINMARNVKKKNVCGGCRNGKTWITEHD